MDVEHDGRSSEPQAASLPERAMNRRQVLASGVAEAAVLTGAGRWNGRPDLDELAIDTSFAEENARLDALQSEAIRTEPQLPYRRVATNGRSNNRDDARQGILARSQHLTPWHII